MIQMRSVARARLLLCGVLLWLLAGSVLAQNTDAGKNVVISQVYGGGGNAGAALKNDFIEIHNRSPLSLNLAGWSVQYASVNGSTWQKTDLLGVLLPGQYLLVKEAQGPGGTIDLPTADVPGTINMSATAGKVALVNTSTTLRGTCPSGNQIVDLVGYGPANCFAGNGPTAAPSNLTALARNDSGCADTSSNDADFAAISPQPRNGATAAFVCPQLGAPIANCPGAVTTIVGQPLSATLNASDSDGLMVSASIVGVATPGISLSGFTPASSVGESASVLLNVDGTTAGGTYGVQISFSNNDPQPQSAFCSVQVSVATIVPGHARIHDVQGRSHHSPLAGQSVTDVPGVVTALRSNGFYLQDPTPDSDPVTSEAIFVFTSSAPTVTAGDSVLVSGAVQEFRPGGVSSANLTQTEIAGPTLTVISHGNALPPPVIIGSGGRVPPNQTIKAGNCGDVEQATCVFDPVNNGIDFYETLEGMLVQVNNAIVVGPTSASGETPVVGDFGVNATQRTVRGGAYVSASDFNPERIILSGQLVGSLPRLNVGDTIATAIGVLDYSSGNFKLQVTQSYTGSSSNLQREITRHQDASQLAIASLNVENLAPGDEQAKFDGLAAQIATNLSAPDIVALLEIQDNDGAANNGVVSASTTLIMLINAIAAAGGPTYSYREIDPVDGQDGGEPGGNIRVAFFFNPARVTFVDRTGGTSTATTTVIDNAGTPRLSFSPGRIDPTNAAFTSSRKPLAGEFVFNGHKLFVIANHFNSKGGDQPLFGRFQPPALTSQVQRVRQAQIVHDFVQSILAIDANANVAVLGDLNDFEFSAPLATLKTGILNDLVEQLPADERYTYVFEGNSQVLDHILVSGSLMPAIEYDIVHTNAEFADQASDHDPEVARIQLPATSVEVTGRLSVKIPLLVYDARSHRYSGTIRVTNKTGVPIVGPIEVELSGLSSGVTLLNASGTHNGAPYVTSAPSLAAGATVSVPVQFSNPSKLPLKYTVKIYSGAF
jgi:predicted extracellular nuclease